MVNHVKWSSIESFYHIRKSVVARPHVTNGNSVVSYRAKIKLHGTCAAVLVEPNGTVTAMSRTVVLTPKHDNAGFATWVESRKEAFASLKPNGGNLVLFGEWGGPGVQKGVALTQMKERIFAVFAARMITENAENDLFITEPNVLRELTGDISNCHVLPWFNDGEQFVVDWCALPETLQPIVDKINDHVLKIEDCDPWVYSQFGIKGIGEGLVFYPCSSEHTSHDSFCELVFKAKGKEHQVVAHTKPVQVDPTVVSEAKAFAELVVTLPRLEQGVRAGDPDCNLVFEGKRIASFLTWIESDINKETTLELEASGLDAKIAMKACIDRARTWYVTEMKKL
jgi:hypothetical protein